MGKKKRPTDKIISNRRARHDYELDDSLVLGIQLTGAETKLLRMGHGNLTGSYVTVKDGELWLLGATIHGTNGIPLEDTTRTRKLLAKQREIESFIAAKQQGRTLVPLDILTKGRFIKLRVAAGRGKKQYDKRQTLKKRDALRDAQRVVR
ncbi:MAG: SsrA-binding protein SmpB [Candidatus Saccharibacteria bacterium]|nr:SsrA-binding protein SmpB [Candidatus Saccharibacteria bacterium]